MTTRPEMAPERSVPLRTRGRGGWLIVGGGVLGLTLAERLLERGQRVTLYEATEQAGGLARPWRVGELHWDRFSQVILPSDARLIALLQRLELGDELRWARAKTGIYCDGRLLSLSSGWELLKFPALNPWDKAKFTWTLCYASLLRDWRSLEFESIEDWLRKMSGDRSFEKVWLPMLKAELGPAYRSASAAFAWAAVAREYRARRGGIRKKMFGYVPGGFQRILDAWIERLQGAGLRLHCRRQVTGISRRNKEPIGLEVQCADDANRGGAAEQFDQVICTAPASTAAALCRQLTDREHAKLDAIQYLGSVVLSLVLKRPLGPFYETHISDAGMPMDSVVEMTAVVDRETFAGRSLVYLPKHLPAHDAGLSTPPEQLTDRFVAALERMYPQFDRRDIEAARVARARQVLPVPTLNYSANLPNVVTSVPGLYVLNSAHIAGGTLNANQTIRLAEQQFEASIWPDALQRGIAAESEPAS